MPLGRPSRKSDSKPTRSSSRVLGDKFFNEPVPQFRRGRQMEYSSRLKELSEQRCF